MTTYCREAFETTLSSMSQCLNVTAKPPLTRSRVVFLQHGGKVAHVASLPGRHVAHRGGDNTNF